MLELAEQNGVDANILRTLFTFSNWVLNNNNFKIEDCGDEENQELSTN
jgi:hypothetical protein